MPIFLQFVTGLVFGLGLVVSGMSNPAKVLNFLDLASIRTGTWDASLLFVLAGAIGVTMIGFRLVLGRSKPVYGEKFHLPTAVKLDARIFIGPAIFGVGWGLAGFCPGPALTAPALTAPALTALVLSASGTGPASVFLFVAAMLAGMLAARWLASRLAIVNHLSVQEEKSHV